MQVFSEKLYAAKGNFFRITLFLFLLTESNFIRKLTQNLIKSAISVLKRSVEPASVNLKKQITVKRKYLNNKLKVTSKSVPFSV